MGPHPPPCKTLATGVYATVLSLIVLTVIGGQSSASASLIDDLDFDHLSDIDDRGVDLRMWREDYIQIELPQVEQPGGGGGYDGGHAYNDSGSTPPPERSSNPCLDANGNFNRECLDALGSICTAGDQIATYVLGSDALMCGDPETLTPSVETQTDEPAGPPPEVIIHTQVTEEFANLPIDGGQVAFDEDLLGFGYRNQHVNIYADVSTQTLNRTMLDLPVEIRAIPVEFHFDYGDGNSYSTNNPGEDYSDFASTLDPDDQMDITTPTSHAYSETGIYPVTLETVFTGEYRIGSGPWTPIPGSTQVPGEPGEADIWRIRHAPVAGSCRDIHDWGCNGPVTLEQDDRPPEIWADQYDSNNNWTGH